MSIVLSHFQAKELLEAKAEGKDMIAATPDLGLSMASVALGDSATFPSGESISFDALREIAKAERKCFLIDNGGIVEIRAFSETTGWVRSLCPTSGAPTMLVSGIPMHRIKDTDPMQDTLQKMRALGPLRGRVLDTATGLGYTAIEAARSADEVVTIEIDPTAIDIARQNPWSRGLFDRNNIVQVVGDAFEETQQFEVGHFSTVIHDPPTIQLAGELYSLEFYKQLHRVLSRTGKLFHYIGDPESDLGKRMTNGVMKRLQEAGFQKVRRHSEAFGVVATKR